MPTTAATLLLRIRATTGRLDATISRVERRLGVFDRKLKSIGTSLTAGFTVPIVGGVAKALGSFGRFDKSIAKSLSVFKGFTAETKAAFSDAARTLSRDSVFAADEVGKAFFFLGSAGLNAQQSIGALPFVLRFAEAAEADLETATTLLVDSQKALRLSSADAAENLKTLEVVGNTLARGNQLANTSIVQLAEALQNKAAAAARAAQIPLEEVTAALLVLAEQGQKGAEAGTQFVIFLREVQEAVQRAPDAFKALNVEIFNARTKGFLPLNEIIRNLTRALGDLPPQLQQARLNLLKFDTLSIQTVKLLLGMANQARRFTEELQVVDGAVEEVASTSLDNLQDRLKVLSGRIGLAVSALGEALAPTIERLVPIVESAVRSLQALIARFDRLSGETKDRIIRFAAVLAAAGPAFLAVSVFTGALRGLLTVVGKLRLAIPLLAGAAVLKALDLAADKIGSLVRAAESLAVPDRASAQIQSDIQRRIERFKGRLFGNDQVEQTRRELSEIRSLMERIGGLAKSLGSEYADSSRELTVWQTRLAEAEKIVARLRALDMTDAAFAFDEQPLARAIELLKQIAAQVEKVRAKPILPPVAGEEGAGGEGGGAKKDPFQALIGVRQTVTEIADETDRAKTAFESFGERALDITGRLQEGMVGIIESFDTGLGDAIGRAIFFYEDLGKAVDNVLRNIGAQAVSQLVRIGAEFVLANLLGLSAGAQQHGTRSGQLVSQAAQGAFAATAVIPIIGPILAPAAAAAAAAGAAAAGAAGFGLGKAAGAIQLAEGGIATRPVVIGEAGPEAFLPLRRINEFLPSGGTTVQLFVDGRLLGQVAAEHMPGVIRARLGTRF